MSRNNINNENFLFKLNVIKSRIDRFYDDGDAEWSKKDFLIHLGEKFKISDPRVQEALRSWEKDGIIRFVGRDDLYFEVLKPFP